MVRLNLLLEKRYKRKDGKFALKISLARNGHTFYISLGVFIKEEDWDKIAQKITGENNRTINNFVQQRKVALEEQLLDLQKNGRLRTLSDVQLLSLLKGETENNSPHYFCDALEKYASTIKNSRTREIYTATANKLKSYCNNYKEITFEEMNLSWLRTFDAYMQEEGLSPNARSIHFRNIRAIFNAAIDDELISCYPFRRFAIPHKETIKRSITVEQMRKLLHLRIPSFQQKYIDCFILMFLLIGINIADLSKLIEVQNGRIIYFRSKTHKKYDIKVEPEAMALINIYRGKSHLLSWFDGVSDYRNFAMRLNGNLHNIAASNGLPNITTYVSRHTWASIAAELDIPKETIAAALGHGGNTVTDIYINFDRRKIDAANRRVIDFVLYGKR